MFHSLIQAFARLSMDDYTIKVATFSCAVWGAALSTSLGFVKFWETFWKDRIRLDTSYSWSGQEGAIDEIVIANLSSVPLQVAYWSLAWKPKLFHFRTSTLDVSPDEVSGFKIDGKDTYTLYFEEQSKFDWGYRTSQHRALYLTLHLFGRKRPKSLRITRD